MKNKRKRARPRHFRISKGESLPVITVYFKGRVDHFVTLYSLHSNIPRDPRFRVEHYIDGKGNFDRLILKSTELKKYLFSKIHENDPLREQKTAVIRQIVSNNQDTSLISMKDLLDQTTTAYWYYVDGFGIRCNSCPEFEIIEEEYKGEIKFSEREIFHKCSLKPQMIIDKRDQKMSKEKRPKKQKKQIKSQSEMIYPEIILLDSAKFELEADQSIDLSLSSNLDVPESPEISSCSLNSPPNFTCDTEFKCSSLEPLFPFELFGLDVADQSQQIDDEYLKDHEYLIDENSNTNPHFPY